MAAHTTRRLLPMPAVRDLVRLYGLQASKSLSQNFLMNLELCDRIVRCVPGIAAQRPRLEALEAERQARLAPAMRQRAGASTTASATASTPIVPPPPPVVEVGPGPGALTRSLFRCGAQRVTVIEKDKRFLAALETLQQSVGPFGTASRATATTTRPSIEEETLLTGEEREANASRLKVVRGDCMAISEDSLLLDHDLYVPTRENAHIGIAVVGNLPFSISTALLLKWVRNAETRTGPFAPALHPFLRDDEVPPVDLVLMFQKEVAERIVAPVGTSEYSRLSVMTQRWFDAKIAFHVNPRNFVPEPKVWSSVVHLTTRGRKMGESWPIGPSVHTDDVEIVCREIFNNRRTMLRRSLNKFGPGGPDGILPRLASSMGATVDEVGSLRPHNLTVDQWCQLTTAYLDWRGMTTEDSPDRLLSADEVDN